MPNKQSKSMNKEIEIRIPSVPRYILLNGIDADSKLHISRFSEEELLEIGKRWTDELIRQAREESHETI